MNVALRKPVAYCKMSIDVAFLTDGVKNIQTPIFLNIICSPRAFIDVQLEEQYYVHYVIVTEGRSLEQLGENKIEFHWLIIINND